MSSGMQVGYRTVDGLQIRYADSDGSASQQLVLTSPWPESLYAFDRMWPRLSWIARLLAIDLPGVPLVQDPDQELAHRHRRQQISPPLGTAEAYRPSPATSVRGRCGTASGLRAPAGRVRPRQAPSADGSPQRVPGPAPYWR